MPEQNPTNPTPSKEVETFVLQREYIEPEPRLAVQLMNATPYVPPPAVSPADKRAIWAQPFLEALATFGSMRAACLAAGIDRSTAYKLMNDDEEFASRVALAREEANDYIEEKLWERGTQGVTQEKGIYGSGIDPDTGKRTTIKIGSEIKTEYSDTAAIFVLKARNPRRYASFQIVENSGPEPELRDFVNAMAEDKGLDPEVVMERAKALIQKTRERKAKGN